MHVGNSILGGGKSKQKAKRQRYVCCVGGTTGKAEEMKRRELWGES